MDDNKKSIINKFVEENTGLIFHETAFNEILADCFNTELSYALAYLKDKLIGICPIHSTKKGILKSSFSNLSQFEVPYGGWVFNNDFTCFNALMNNLQIGFNEVLTYWTSILSSADKINVNKSYSKLFSALIDLDKKEKDIWETDIKAKRRNMIRKAVKFGITVKLFGLNGLNLFYSLLLEMNKKSGMHSKTKEYYEKILEKYYPSKAVIFLASLNGDFIAGNMLIGNISVTHYWQGASKLGIGNFGQGELLQWESIKWAKSKGSKFYDLCVIEEERLPNIAQFKMGFSKQLVPFYCITKKTLLFRVLNKIQKLLG